MKKNVGNFDRIARFILGAVIIALGIYFQSWFGLIGLVPLFTASINYCPIYGIFGMSSKPKVKVEKL